MIALFLPLLLAHAPLSVADAQAVDAKVAEIFRPYAQDAADTPPWDYPIYSAEVTALIAEWQKVVPHDEPDSLNDGDWLCQCQDWDAEAFKAAVVSTAAIAPDAVEVALKIDLGLGDPGGTRDARLVLRREGAGWRLDDLFAETMPHGLKQALRQTIAEDKALAAADTK